MDGCMVKVVWVGSHPNSVSLVSHGVASAGKENTGIPLEVNEKKLPSVTFE